MGSTVQDLLEKRNNPEHLNWVAVGDALIILCDGLRQYADKKMKELHALMISKLRGLKCCCPCVPGIKLIKSCSHTCMWATELRNLHFNKTKSRIPWHQSDSSKWHDPANGYWEIAKLFMSDLGSNWRDVKDPSTTDPTGLLNLLFFCTHFKVQQHLIKSVRELRNEWAHAPDHMLRESDKQSMFKEIVSLINDVELMSCKEVQDCRAVIEEVRVADVSIIQEKHLRVLQELNCLEEREKQRHVSEEIVKTIREEIILSNADGRVQNPVGNDYPRLSRMAYNVSSFHATLFLTLFQVFSTKSKCPQFLRRLLLLVLFVSQVGDKSVLLLDNGCSRAIIKSPISHFDFQEFDFSSYLAYKREHFFGRRWLFRELEEIFESGRGPAGVLITGDPGSGKSALMSQLICSPFSSLLIHNNIIGYHLCDYSEKGKRDGARFVRNLVDQIAGSIPEYSNHVTTNEQIQRELDKRCDRDATGCFFTTVVGPLRELKSKPDSLRYIVLDALDECFEKDGNTSPILDILSSKISHFPKWLKIIISSRNWTAVTSKMPRTLKRMPLDPTDERNVEDIRSYITRFLSQNLFFMDRLLEAMSLKSTKEGINSWVNELTNRGEGNFLFVKTTLQNNMDESGGRVNLQSFPTSLYDTYDKFFKRHFSENDLDRFKALFEVLLAAGSSFQLNEIGLILKLQNQTLEISRLSSFLRFGQDGTVSIYHQSFADWLTNEANGLRGFSICKSRGHQYIVDFLLDRVRKENAKLTFKEVSELSMHVVSAGGPTESHKKALQLLNVSKIRDPRNGKCILHDLADKARRFPILQIFLRKFVSADISDMEGKTPAFYAASEGIVGNLKLFINKGVNVNYIFKNFSSDPISAVVQNRGVEDFSMIHVAAYKGHDKIVKLLITSNVSYAEISKNGPTPFHLAAGNGHLEIVKLLYNNGAKADLISLHHAAARNHSAVVEFLLKTTAVRDECLPCTPANLSNFSRNVSFWEFHISFCETALHAAVSRRHIDIVKLLLKFGRASLKCKHHSGKTPLMDAVERNDTEMVELLLNEGANVEALCGSEISRESSDQMCVILSLYKNGFLYTVYCKKYVCACGNKAIHLCARYGLWEMAKKLIHKWNVNLLDKTCKGETVWKIADLFHHEDFIYHGNRMLLSLDEPETSLDQQSSQLTAAKYRRRTFKKLLRKFCMKTKPYQTSFQCDSTFEGLSPLHIAALMGVRMLKRVYKKAHKIVPNLPLNCTNMHWIVPRYLAYFYESVHTLTNNPSTLKQNAEHTNNMLVPLQYPDREAEYHIIYNYFYNSPAESTNILYYESLPTLIEYDISNCPGFYDLLPKRKTLNVKKYCEQYHYTPTVKTDRHNCSPTESSLQPLEFCQPNQPVFFICIREERLVHEKFAEECFCPLIMRELQMWFTSFPRQNRRVSQFIAERMGWKDTSADGDVQDRWPFYFLYRKVINAYKSYKYLETLNEGSKIIDKHYHDYKEEEEKENN